MFFKLVCDKLEKADKTSLLGTGTSKYQNSGIENQNSWVSTHLKSKYGKGED